jgi:hypothetical protein
MNFSGDSNSPPPPSDERSCLVPVFCSTANSVDDRLSMVEIKAGVYVFCFLSSVLVKWNRRSSEVWKEVWRRNRLGSSSRAYFQLKRVVGHSPKDDGERVTSLCTSALSSTSEPSLSPSLNLTQRTNERTDLSLSLTFSSLYLSLYLSLSLRPRERIFDVVSLAARALPWSFQSVCPKERERENERERES